MKNILLLLSVQLLVVASKCPDGFVQHQTSCYHFSHDKESYILAENVCKMMNAHLVKIDTSEEGVYLSNTVLNLHGDHHWIGLNDIHEEGVWRWHTNGALLSAEVANWDGNEPNNSNPGLENCVVMKSDGRWGDDVCMNSHNFICETNDETEIVG